MNDPYMPLEKDIRLTRRALEVIAGSGFPVHAITKSDLVLRDLDLLEEINRKTYAAVTFTVTTADDALSRRLEPGAPVSSRRLAALRILNRRGLLTGITLMPVLPFIEDNEENIRQIITLAAGNGARYILPAFGMTLRDRQRTYYYNKLDQLFSPACGRVTKKRSASVIPPRRRMRTGLGKCSTIYAGNMGLRQRFRSSFPKNAFASGASSRAYFRKSRDKGKDKGATTPCLPHCHVDFQRIPESCLSGWKTVIQ
jgi:DNA repair photolyase